MNRAIRIMCFAPLGRFDVEPLFETLEILNIEDMYKLELGKFMFKKQYDMIPVPITNYFKYREAPQHGYNLNARDVIPALAVGHNSIYGEHSIQIR